MKNRFLRVAVLTVILLSGFLAGRWAVNRFSRPTAAVPTETSRSSPVVAAPVGGPDAAIHPAREEREAWRENLPEEAGERVVRFASDEAYQRFLARLEGSNVRVLGRLDPLRSVRVGFDRFADLAAVLGDESEVAANFPVFVPEPSPDGVQPGAVGFGATLLEWLGVEGDHSSWGKGVTIAVLDTGIAEHPTLGGTIRHLDLVAMANDAASLHGHGTAVASLIAGGHPLAPGVAPGAELLSVRIADSSGISSSFSLAQGILAAVDAGAQVINISMGSYGNASIVLDAVRYAQNRGAVLVASAGNDGAGSPAYPAAYPGVIAVGAVDARAERLEFSNSGNGLSLTAPGYILNAAWPGEKLIEFTGTSASAPVVAGAIAATMSHGGSSPLSAAQAVQQVMAYLNDAGSPGADPFYGAGWLDLGRVMRHDQPGIVDAAVAGAGISERGTLQVTVQNRGTEVLVNTGVEVNVGGATQRMNVTSLAPNAIHTFEMPFSGSSGSVTTRVLPTATDAYPANNQRTDVLSAP